MYMRQMGKVPLLTREQEVAICKRIEEAEHEQKRILYRFGFTAKEHIALAEKLISEPPKERFDRVIVDNQLEGRELHLKPCVHSSKRCASWIMKWTKNTRSGGRRPRRLQGKALERVPGA